MTVTILLIGSQFQKSHISTHFQIGYDDTRVPHENLNRGFADDVFQGKNITKQIAINSKTTINKFMHLHLKREREIIAQQNKKVCTFCILKFADTNAVARGRSNASDTNQC